MKNTGNIALVISISLALFIVIDKFSGKSRKIGVVQMDKLVYEFAGMKEATKKYEGKMTRWNTENDSLQNRLKELYAQIKTDSIKKDFNKLKMDIELFQLYRQGYAEYAEKTQQLAANEDKQMTVGVINQLNGYIKDYAEKQGYDVILCNQPQTPSIGYTKEQVDITKEVLEFSNQSYNGVTK